MDIAWKTPVVFPQGGCDGHGPFHPMMSFSWGCMRVVVAVEFLSQRASGTQSVESGEACLQADLHRN